MESVENGLIPIFHDYEGTALLQTVEPFQRVFIRNGVSVGVKYISQWAIRSSCLGNRLTFMFRIRMGVNQGVFQICMAKPLGDQCKAHAMLVKVHGSAVAEQIQTFGFQSSSFRMVKPQPLGCGGVGFECDKTFTKANLDYYLKELAKAFRKRNGKNTPAEIIEKNLQTY